MTIYVDADACPVKAEVERVATRHRLRVLVVSNGGIRPSANPLVETVIVPEGPDEADKWIAERAGGVPDRRVRLDQRVWGSAGGWSRPAGGVVSTSSTSGST